ncbi:hypothetical protein ACWEK5_48100, partial [Rhodococcus koreensis]
ERRGTWVYYWVIPSALQQLSAALLPVLRTGRRGESLRSPPGSRCAARGGPGSVAVDRVASLL